MIKSSKIFLTAALFVFALSYLHTQAFATNFSAISGLSYNQTQVAKTFDILSAQAIGSDLAGQISYVDALPTDDLKKSALLDASGYFLANVIRSATSENERQNIYNKMKYHDINVHNLKGLWVQGRTQFSEIAEDDNSKNKYNNLETGMLAGWDTVFSDHGFMLGFYGKYNKHDVKQDVKNTAGIEGFGFGVYGGFLKDEWELKAMVSGNFDNFTTVRYVDFADRKARADFSGMTIAVDFEGAIRSYVTESVILKPLAGMEIRSMNYGSFNEKIAGDLSLKVSEGNYFRTAARIGIGIGSDDDVRLEWYADVEGRYLLSEEEPEITAAFAGTSQEFQSKGAKEGSTIIGLGGGGAYRISDKFKIFANISYQSTQDYQNISGNFGVRWLLK
ncbi:MAG: autotransporter outer membrane beta-barrel domain-containing protein [Endomicrobia bacterium]|nr:autotransporter outer membrane beta-barrel domain-containing protein [Endomicrobiia bacterium]